MGSEMCIRDREGDVPVPQPVLKDHDPFFLNGLSSYQGTCAGCAAVRSEKALPRRRLVADGIYLTVRLHPLWLEIVRISESGH